MKNFNKAIKLDHKYTEAYYNRGVSYDLIGNYPRALLNFKECSTVRQ
ncbi:MAG: tetratricopeptide repeat protein [Proteobacteria bacterium]|nr:tetratricopeptide repeat protein [Pseudomonadota bacterium]